MRAEHITSLPNDCLWEWEKSQNADFPTVVVAGWEKAIALGIWDVVFFLFALKYFNIVVD